MQYYFGIAVDCAGRLLDVQMTIIVLLEKLMEIERALQRGEYVTAQKLLLDAEDCTLHIQREMLRMEAENLRRAANEKTLRPHLGFSLSRIIPFKRH